MAPPRRPTLNNSDAPELELGAHGSRKSRGQAECDGRFHRLNLSVTAAATAAIIPNIATRARRGMWAQACCAAS